jgi:uncharacterized membrane protein
VTQHPKDMLPARLVNLSLGAGRFVFSAAIVALGSETVLCAGYADKSHGGSYRVIPVIPWLPAIPWLACFFGAIVVACGAGILLKRTARPASLVLGSLFFLCALILDLPIYAHHLGNMGLRTEVFEPLSLATLAWLLADNVALPGWLSRGARYVLAVSLLVFGVDHFIGIVFIATLIPTWIPWREFWVGLFGVVFIVAGIAIGLKTLQTWGAFALGLMFAVWVFTLHLPRVLGLYGIPGAPHNPNEWESLFIAVALWGGPWAIARPGKASKPN